MKDKKQMRKEKDKRKYLPRMPLFGWINVLRTEPEIASTPKYCDTLSLLFSVLFRLFLVFLLRNELN